MSGLRHSERRRLSRSLRWRRLHFEPLEDRRVLSVFTVNSTGDEPDLDPGDGKAETITGTTTLRAAITEANVQLGKDTIEFNIPGSDFHLIRPATSLPLILDPITIDGYSQPGATPTTLTLKDGNDAFVKIELDGSLLPIGSNGLEIISGQSEVRGLAIHSFYGKPIPHEELLGVTIVAESGFGISLRVGGSNIVSGNYLGAKANGLPPANTSSKWSITSGISVGSSDNVIQENIIVGSETSGITLGAKVGDSLASVHDNRIYGNYIGMAQDGETPLPNDAGVLICWGAYGNYIGGDSENFGNLISGNVRTGISIVGLGAGGTYVGSNVIQRNLIGTDRIGNLVDPDDTPNSGDETGNRHVGIQIKSSPNNTIGGTTSDAGNVISGNKQGGVLIVDSQSKGNKVLHNKIGTDYTGSKKLGNGINGVEFQNAPENFVEHNTISGNKVDGVRLGGEKTRKNTVRSNFLGTDSSGKQRLGNGFSGVGIYERASENKIHNNVISANQVGVTLSGARNLNLITGNRIGTNAAGDAGLGNTGNGIYTDVSVQIGTNKASDRNIISGNGGHGIVIDATGGTIHGNYIGLAADGETALGNTGSGITIVGGSHNNIGGDVSGERNVISSNKIGISVGAESNNVWGNYIGTDKNGAHKLGLGNVDFGVFVAADKSEIGGTDPKSGNIIVGTSNGPGIALTSDNNRVFNNRIGVDKKRAKGPNQTAGVNILGGSQNMIGADLATSKLHPNEIAGNNGDGVRVELGDSNAIRGNSIYDNTKLGINLVGGGTGNLRERANRVTPNDHGDNDSGANELMNFPVGVTAWYDPRNGITYISGIVDAESPVTVVVEIFANRSADPTGFGEGELYLDKTVPDEAGRFRLEWSGPLPVGYPVLSATATSLVGFGSTSEFSPAYSVNPDTGKVDSDEDGLPDDWEKNGIDFNGDGITDLDLATLGAAWNHKDIFIEVDYMAGMRPLSASLSLVEEAFRKAPVSNPDGQNGIRLHNLVDDDDNVPFYASLRMAAPTGGSLPQHSYWELKKQFFGTQDDRNTPDGRAPDVLGARGLAFHYTLFGNKLDDGNPLDATTLGVSTLWGNDIYLCYGAVWQHKITAMGGLAVFESGLYMHELGHNLGLGHGGPLPPGQYVPNVQGHANISWKPNYLSVMNYSFLSYTHAGYRPLDYSRVVLPDLEELKLDENQGVWPPGISMSPDAPWLFTVSSFPKSGSVTYDKQAQRFVYTPAAKVALSRSFVFGPTDWNHDGQFPDPQIVQADINAAPGKAPTQSIPQLLKSADDWPYLRYNFRPSKLFGFGLAEIEPGSIEPEELTPEMIETATRAVDSDDDGLSDFDDNVPFVFNPDQADSDGDGLGDAGELVSLVLDRQSVVAGAQVNGMVTSLVPAPPEGLIITLWTSDGSVVQTPTRVVIPEGQRSVAFVLETLPVLTTSTSVDVYAHYWGNALSTQLTVGPPLPNADLELIQTAAPDPVALGGSVTYTTTVTNHGPTSAVGVTLTDTLPTDAVLLSADGIAGIDVVPGPGLTVKFDYTYDTSGFFDTEDKKELLQEAGDILLSVMGDDLASIIPDGENSWTAIFPNPATGAELRVTDLVIPENEIVVFVGARDLGNTGTAVFEGALAGPGGLESRGSSEFNRIVTTRGEPNAGGPAPTDFGPWGGTITFNTNPSVNFSYSGQVQPGELDFFTVALHEMAHVLGLGTSESWQTYVDATQGVFRGPAARLEYDAGGDVPLDPATLAHWREGITESDDPVLMDPLLPQETRLWYPTALDWAGLADVGWNTDGMLTVERPVIFSQVEDAVIGDIGVLEPGQSVTMTLEVQPTVAGTIHNVATVSGYGDDPDLSNNSVEITGTVTPLVLIVNTTDDLDDGVVDAVHTSLREAINAANKAPGLNTISFDILGPGPHTIQLTSPLPIVTEAIVIDAATEPDYAGAPVVELDGSLAGASNGLHLTAGNSTIQGLAINRFQSDGTMTTGHGIVLEGGDESQILGCFIGTDVGGTLDRGNTGAGVLALDSAKNTIGGTTSDMRNVISANQQQGIFLGPASNANIILGNFIGTDATGALPLGNSVGVKIVDASENVIGGTEEAARNVISSNRIGVTIQGTNETNVPMRNRIEGNYIGTNAAGDTAVGNGAGVVIVDAHETLVGGGHPDAGNLISGNEGDGVWVSGYLELLGLGKGTEILGNRIGTAADGTSPLGNADNGVLAARDGIVQVGGIAADEGNTIAFNGGNGVATDFGIIYVIRGNAIFNNAGLGIDAGSNGVTPNRPASAAPWYYGSNYPELTRAFTGGGSTTVEGTITGPDFPAQGVLRESLLDFYAVATPDATGFGEGAIYLGAIATMPQGVTAFEATLPVEAPPGYYITATGTRDDLFAGSPLRTSEFSQAIEASPDADGDSVLDELEDAAPNNGDGNGDGVLDSLQNHVVSLPNAVDGQYAVLVSSGGGFRDVEAIPNPAAQTGPTDVSFPIGFFDFTLQATAATVSVFPPAGIDLTTAYQYGPTPLRPFDHWYQTPSSRMEVHPDHLDIRLRDGAEIGDHDLTENQQILTRVGPALILPSAGTTIVVNAADDVDDGVADGVHTSLREAINLANFLPGKDHIVFDIPGDGPHTIQPTSSLSIDPLTRAREALPTITDSVVIDGYTQFGASPASDDDPAVIMVELDGSLADWPVNGLVVDADECVIRGLAINRFRSERYGFPGGIQVYITSTGNVVEGNYLGVDASGTTTYYEPGQLAYAQSYGILAYSDDNVMGGSAPAARNVISGFSRAGVYGVGKQNRILGNFIGTDARGTQALGNAIGIRLDSYAAQNVIGGTESGAGNLISGNSDVGVSLFSCGAGLWENRVQGNLIGTDVTGMDALGNGVGVQIISGYENLIGGLDPGAGNVISGNDSHGIMIMPCEISSIGNVVQGNLIGTDVHGNALGNAGDGILIEGSHRNIIGGVEPGAGNRIAHNGAHGVTVAGGIENALSNNRIDSNGDLGIDLGGDGVTANDHPDGPLAPEFVVDDLLMQFDGTYTTISATVTGPPNTYFELWLYVDGPSTPILVTWMRTDENGKSELYMDWLEGRWDVEGIVARDSDTLSAPNGFQNYPILNSAVLAADTTVEGSLDSTPETTLRLEFFSNVEADGSGYGEGDTLLGSVDVTTDSDGLVDFIADLPARVPVGHFITATATDPQGNTSEFAEAIEVVAESLDFGDAQDTSYPTLLATDGARHVVVTGLHLGDSIDAEPDGQSTDLADGDDATGSDDEDGVTFLTPFVPGELAAIEVTASAQGRLDAWMDFGGDGSWLDAGDHVFADVTLLPGPNTLFFDVPATAEVGTDVVARFRFSSGGDLPFTGLAMDGEVEDHVVTVAQPAEGNRPPAAVDDTATTPVDQPVAIDVTANDVDPEGQLVPSTVMVSTVPTSGTVFVEPQSGVITYVPQAGFLGADAFSYRVSDAAGLADTAIVLVNVVPGNRPPIAGDDEVTTGEEDPVTIAALENDQDPDGNLDASTVEIVSPASHGLLELDEQSGLVTYVPEIDFSGADQFVYSVRDTEGASDTAVVEITVNAVSDPPLARDDFIQTDENVPVVVDVLANDFDADGDLDPTSVSVVNAPQHGSADVDSVTGHITYSPNVGFTGIDVLLYRVLDLTGQEATATLWVDVVPTNYPPQAASDEVDTPEDTPVSIDVASNDTDPDGDLDPGSVTILVGPMFGSVEVDTQTGEIRFTPAGDFTGIELLWYQISDALGQSDTGLVRITVTPVNDPPRANDDTAVILRDTPTDIYVLSNDIDVDSVIDPTTLRIETDPVFGSVELQVNGSVRYSPGTGFTGSDQFRYSVADDFGARSNTAKVAITVHAEPQMLVVGRAFEDLDEDGPGLEGPGLAGYPIYLLDGQGQPVDTALTQGDDSATSEDETGWYHFPGLPPGTYVVAEKKVAGWWQSHPEDHGIRLPEANVNPGLYVVTLSIANETEVLDFGNYRSGEAGHASISGLVYVDVDDDGICDPQEMRLPNVPILIEGPVTRAIMTGPDGSYRAEDLPPGVYTITETQPLLFHDGQDTPGTPLSGTVEDDRFVNVELLPDMVAEDYNFGECGLKAQYVSKRMLLSSTPSANGYLADLEVASGESLLALDTPESGELTVTANAEGETPRIQLYDALWRPVTLTTESGVLRTPVSGNDRLLVYVASAAPTMVSARLKTASVFEPVYVHTNPLQADDVNGDGYVSPMDALLVIHGLNVGGMRLLEGVNLSAYYCDVSGDGLLSPYDALLVIRSLNRQSAAHDDDGGEGEGERLSVMAYGALSSMPHSRVEALPRESSAPSDLPADDEVNRRLDRETFIGQPQFGGHNTAWDRDVDCLFANYCDDDNDEENELDEELVEILHGL